MLCSISGEVARDPVINVKSGHVYERSLINKHLTQVAADPVSGEDSSIDDLIDVKSVNPIVRPRVGPVSLPGLMSSMQDEWDALMLETYTLRTQLHTSRKELSHALYQYDAACRVIARLVEERDQARALLSAKPSQAQPQPSGEASSAEPAGAEAMEVEPSIELGEAAGVIQTKAAEVSKTRRENFKKPSEDLATEDDLKAFEESSTHTVHLSTKPGVLCVDAHQSHGELVATGGIDTRVIVFNADTHKVSSTLKGHSKSVGAVVFHPSDVLVASGADDSTVRLWSLPSARSKSLKESGCVEVHDGAIKALSMHVSGSYLAAVSEDKSWSLIDLSSGSVVHQYISDEVRTAYTSGAFHPDGALFAAADSSSVVHIWDALKGERVQTFEGHSGSITSLSFSENGYYLATGDDSATVKIWDLRKLKSVVDLSVDSPVSRVRFNSSGHFLAVATQNSISVYKTDKKMPLLNTLDASDHAPSDVVFGRNSQFLASVSLDRHLTFYSKKE